jgi:hypothetical protein
VRRIGDGNCHEKEHGQSKGECCFHCITNPLAHRHRGHDAQLSEKSQSSSITQRPISARTNSKAKPAALSLRMHRISAFVSICYFRKGLADIK